MSPTGGSREVKFGDTRITYGIAYDQKSAEIISVRTPVAKRGSGSARKALQAFVDEADRAGMVLRLGASPLDKKTHLGKLVRFYQSLGFVLTGKTINAAGEPELVRQPRES
jgi:GNAT superfamily N-acetyltransferase